MPAKNPALSLRRDVMAEMTNRSTIYAATVAATASEDILVNKFGLYAANIEKIADFDCLKIFIVIFVSYIQQQYII